MVESSWECVWISGGYKAAPLLSVTPLSLKLISVEVDALLVIMLDCMTKQPWKLEELPAIDKPKSKRYESES
jgi:hypothetical protein